MQYIKIQKHIKPSLYVYRPRGANDINCDYIIGYEGTIYTNEINAKGKSYEKYAYPVIKNVCPLLDDIKIGKKGHTVIAEYQNHIFRRISLLQKYKESMLSRTKITKHNYWNSTECDFQPCLKPKKKCHYESDSGSKYWIYDDYVIRYSNHWGAIGSCLWTIEGEWYNKKDSFSGIVWYNDMIRKPMKVEIKKALQVK